jgi:DNA gyrase subunit A
VRAMGRSAVGVWGIRLEEGDEVVNMVVTDPLPAGPLPADPLPAGPLPAGPLPAGPLPAGPPPTDSAGAGSAGGAGTLLTVCANGYGKRTLVEEYRQQSRGGKGIIDIRTSDRNGKVVNLLAVKDDDEVMMITKDGQIVRTKVEGISVIGRNTQGVRCIALNEGDQLVSVARIPSEEPETGLPPGKP